MFKSLLTIHFINDIVSSVIGILANLLAIYVVRKRTAKEMRQYSQSLTQNCTFDLLMNIVVFITKEQFETYDGVFILMSTGVAARVPHPWDMLFHMAYLFTAMFCLISMLIPFYCRYRVFCRNDMLSDYRIFSLYFFASSIILLWSVLYGCSLIPDEHTRDMADAILKDSIFVKDDRTIPIYVATRITNWFFIMALFTQCILMSSAYGLMIYFGIKINKSLKEKESKLSQPTFKFHREINIVLVIQAIVPIVVGSTTVPSVILFAVFKVRVSGFLLFGAMALSWICVVNPIFAIFMVKHYRKAILNPGKYLFSQFTRSNTISITN